MHSIVLTGLVVVEIAYLVIGGLIFWALESSREEDHKQAQRNFNLTALINNLTASHVCITAENLTTFVQRVLEAERLGLTTPKESYDWNIHGSIFFAMTAVTTIGYGNVTPKTTGGQIFCCFFVIIGVPITMVMILGLGNVLKTVSEKITCRCLCRNRPRVARFIKSVAITTVCIVLFLLVPAAIFTKLEGWGYGSALYYGVITTAAVGFGDYVAGWNCVGSLCWLYRISVGIWIFFGLAWLAGVIGSIQDFLQTLLTKTSVPLKQKLRGDEKKRKKDGKSDTESEMTGNDVTTSSEPISVIHVDHPKYVSVRL